MSIYSKRKGVVLTSGIYSIRNTLNGKVYVGKSINIERRFSLHRHLLNKEIRDRDVNRHLFNAVKKYGIDKFSFEIIEEVEGEALLADRELFWMVELKSTNRDFGYNLRMDSSSKCYVHDETKEIFRNMFSGEGNPNFGNYWSDDQKLRMSAIAKSRHKTGVYGDEWKSKISKASSEMWKDEEKKSEMAKKVSESKRKYNFEQYSKDGNLLKVWESVEQIVLSNPEYKWQNIYSVCNGYKKSYRGYIWKKKLKI